MDNTIISFLPLMFVLGFAIVLAIPYWKICDRTGLSKWMLLALLIRIIGWFVPWFIAFSRWPKVDGTRNTWEARFENK